jgi:predicted DNA-binding mobile mystery protein A
MSAAELGRRLGVSHTSVFDLERSERAGSVRLDTLRRAADALDCSFVYAFVPRRGLEETVRARAEDLAEEDLRIVEHTMALEDQTVDTPPALREELVQQLVDSRGLWSRRP